MCFLIVVLFGFYVGVFIFPKDVLHRLPRLGVCFSRPYVGVFSRPFVGVIPRPFMGV